MTITNIEPPSTVDENQASAEDYRQVMNGLLSGLSHDLRTPLSTINGWLFVLDSDKLDSAAKKRTLDKMRTTIEDQVRLIDDVLPRSRSLTGHLVVDAELISPLTPLEIAMENLHATAAAGSVRLPPTKVNENGKIMADGELLLRVLEILLLHALKTTPVGGLVETAVGVRDDHVEITISDNGKGLNPNDLPFLFDAFRSAESKLGSAYPGAEHNLMLARALVEKQQGQLQATSRGPSLGSTFTLRMPCMAVPTSTINAAQK